MSSEEAKTSTGDQSTSTSSPSDVGRTENWHRNKWDRCLADSAIKMGTGLGVGVVFSFIFFKRRPWPLAFGAGVGLGMAYSNCQNSYRRPPPFWRRENGQEGDFPGRWRLKKWRENVQEKGKELMGKKPEVVEPQKESEGTASE